MIVNKRIVDNRGDCLGVLLVYSWDRRGLMEGGVVLEFVSVRFIYIWRFGIVGRLCGVFGGWGRVGSCCFWGNRRC